MPTLAELLEQSRAAGFLGPGPVSAQLDLARGFGGAIAHSGCVAIPPANVLDLGAGGGVPGLVLAELWAETLFLFLDANRRRTDFLTLAVESLGWGSRVRVLCERAELAGRQSDLRGAFGLVVARSFGPPATTAECAAPFLKTGGRLAVTEPPDPETGATAGEPGENVGAKGGRPAPSDGPVRWPAKGCALLGLEPETHLSHPVAVQILRQASPCPERFPRRDGVPGKRPLF